MEYKLIYNNDAQKFVDAVTTAITNGYWLIGSVSIAYTPEAGLVFAQALVKGEQPDNIRLVPLEVKDSAGGGVTNTSGPTDFWWKQV